MNNRISVILPCQNERETISSCVDEIRDVAEKNHLEIEIIVSDSSSDGSDRIAKEMGVIVLKHDTDGYGFAIREGVKRATGDIIIYADADGTYNFSDIPNLLENLEENIVIGSRLRGNIDQGAMPPLHRFFGTPLLNNLLRIFFGIKIGDSQSGFRAMSRRVFDALDLKTDGMEFATEMIIKARERHIPFREVPISYRKRKGVSKLRRYRDGFAHLKYIVLKIPFTLYRSVGFVFFLLGVMGLGVGSMIGGIFDSATVKIFFPVIGTELFFLGLFAKTYLMTRFGEEDGVITKWYSWFRLPFALFLGALFLLYAVITRILVPGFPFDRELVSVFLGFQIIINSLVLSFLSIRHTT